MDGNYIKLSRGLLEWEWYTDINTTRLFIHMLLKANWKDGNFKGTTVPRGSFVSSIGKLSSEIGLTEREIRTAISHLKMTGEVTSKTANRFTVFTVVKYDLYQTNDKQNVSQEPVKRQPNDILTTAIEEKKEGKKGRNTPLYPPWNGLRILPQLIRKSVLAIWLRQNTAMRYWRVCRKRT